MPSVRGYWDTDRTEAFSDGVFAIAITLLVLDLSVSQSELDDLWRGIAHQWPAYLGYATSFITIGGIWMAHHSIFSRLRFANSGVMRINLALVMAVAFLPFPTRLMAEALRHSQSAERVAVIFYGAALLAISLLFSALWGVVSRDRNLLRADVSEAEVKAIGRASAPNVGFYVLATVVAIVTPKVAAFVFLVVAVLSIVRVRGYPTSEQATAPPRT